MYVNCQSSEIDRTSICMTSIFMKSVLTFGCIKCAVLNVWELSLSQNMLQGALSPEM